ARRSWTRNSRATGTRAIAVQRIPPCGVSFGYSIQAHGARYRRACVHTFISSQSPKPLHNIYSYYPCERLISKSAPPCPAVSWALQAGQITAPRQLGG